MAKQAQFTSDKTVFNETLDFPEASGVYKFFNKKKMKLSILVRQKT